MTSIFIGTYKAIEMLSNDFRQIRRVTGMGLVEMNFLEKEEFDLFIEDIWRFQWIKNKCVLTDSLKKTMYDCTIGIPDIIKKLFKVVQIDAIVSGSETITEKQIERMLKEKFPFVKNVIEKIKSGRVNEVYDDLRSPSLLNEYIENSEIDIKNREEARKIIQSKERKEMINETKVISDLCIFMEEFGYSYKDIEKIAKKVVKSFGYDKQISFLKNELMKEIYKSSSQDDTNTKAKAKKTEKRNKEVDEKEVEEFLKENIKA